MEFVRCEIADRIGTITLDHPKKLNALSEALVHEVIAAFKDFAAAGVRAAILRARPGARVWSAGHDVSALPEGRRDPLGWDDPLRDLVRTIETFPAPVLALVEGGVWGGAVETVLACDIIIAAPDVTFAITPARLGVPYNLSGMVTFRSAARLRIDKELIFTAAPITAARAERVGMINHVVEAAEIESFTRAMALQICNNAPLAIIPMKEELRVLAGARPVSPRGFEKVQGMRRIAYDSADYAEGIKAFKEKRKPVFEGR